MKQCEIRVVTPGGRDNTALTETFRRLGYPVANGDDTSLDGDEIMVLDARASDLAEWAEIERDLGERRGPAVVISDDHIAATALAQRAGRSVVFASGESEMGYSVAVKLCALLREEELEGAAA
jgi:hypothetical protein